MTYEKSFTGLYPVSKEAVQIKEGKEISFEFHGTGFILTGEPKTRNNSTPEYVVETEVYLDGQKIESPKLPTDFTTRRLEISWKYPLTNGKHHVIVKILNPDNRFEIRNVEYIVFSDKPIHDPLK